MDRRLAPGTARRSRPGARRSSARTYRGRSAAPGRNGLVSRRRGRAARSGHRLAGRRPDPPTVGHRGRARTRHDRRLADRGAGGRTTAGHRLGASQRLPGRRPGPAGARTPAGGPRHGDDGRRPRGEGGPGARLTDVGRPGAHGSGVRLRHRDGPLRGRPPDGRRRRRGLRAGPVVVVQSVRGQVSAGGARQPRRCPRLGRRHTRGSGLGRRDP